MESLKEAGGMIFPAPRSPELIMHAYRITMEAILPPIEDAETPHLRG